ncbi:MAG: MopE-related protein [Pseudomonadota bacterium]
MRLLLLLTLAACGPDPLYRVRRPDLRLDLPCADSGDDCRDLYLLDIAYERTGDLSFTIWNDGELPLHVSLSADSADFAVSVPEATVASGGHKVIQVSYTPSCFEDQQASLVLTHDALGDPITLTLHGNTDADADDDGYRTDLAPGGDDCNDFNATVNPGAEESWYDGIDQDCDGWSDYDQDRDGYDLHTRPDGDDCNDEDPRIHPDAPDAPDDGIDQDCDGEDG